MGDTALPNKPDTDTETEQAKKDLRAFMVKEGLRQPETPDEEERRRRNDLLFNSPGLSTIGAIISQNILGTATVRWPVTYWFDESEGKGGRKVKVFNVKRMGDAILDYIPVIHTIDTDDVFTWLVNHYEANGEHYIGRIVNAQLQEDFSIDRLNKVIAYVRTVTHENIRHARTHEELLSPDLLIPFKNGIYDLSSNRLNPYTKDFFFMEKLNITFDSEAKCPAWLQFLLQSVPNQQDRATLQEYLGLCLTQSLRFHKALFLVGPTHAGKSTFCKVVKAAWGALSINIPLQTLIYGGNTGEFARARLFGKLVNVFPDIPKDNMDNDSWFLALTGDDYISARTPCHSSFDFHSTCKQIYTANKLPKTENHGDEFFIRILIVEFPNMFLPGTPGYDPNLIEKLTAEQELSGIGNWALEGLQRALKNKEITQRLSIDDTKEAWEQISDNISKYCATEVEPDRNGVWTKDEIYYDYVRWCNENNEISETRDYFLEEFRKHFSGEIEEIRPKKEKRKRAFKGINLKNAKHRQSGLELGEGN